MWVSEKNPSETVWKIAWRVLDRLCLVAQEGEMGYLRSVLATRYTPDEAYSDLEPTPPPRETGSSSF